MTVECCVGLICMILQMLLALINSSEMAGNTTFSIRVPESMSWLRAREFCANASHSLLPSVWDVRALNSLSVGEFAWINAKEYSFCYPSKENNTVEECIYITVAQEDKRRNLTYICSKDNQFETTEDKLSFYNADQRCLKTSRVLQRVNTFTLPLILPGNKTSWIDKFDRQSIIDSLKSNQRVNETCLGVIKLTDERFNICTTSCNENHTVLCEKTKLDTAETLTRKVKMLSTLEEQKREILVLRSAAEDMETEGDDGGTKLVPIVIGSTIGGVLLLAAIVVMASFAFRKFRKIPSPEVSGCHV